MLFGKPGFLPGIHRPEMSKDLNYVILFRNCFIQFNGLFSKFKSWDFTVLSVAMHLILILMLTISMFLDIPNANVKMTMSELYPQQWCYFVVQVMEKNNVEVAYLLHMCCYLKIDKCLQWFKLLRVLS